MDIVASASLPRFWMSRTMRLISRTSDVDILLYWSTFRSVKSLCIFYTCFCAQYPLSASRSTVNPFYNQRRSLFKFKHLPFWRASSFHKIEYGHFRFRAFHQADQIMVEPFQIKRVNAFVIILPDSSTAFFSLSTKKSSVLTVSETALSKSNARVGAWKSSSYPRKKGLISK
jgi:hypothetical protein